MSRIGKLPVTIPVGVQVKVDGLTVQVQGAKGQLTRTFNPEVAITMENGQVIINRNSDEMLAKALHGTTRAILQNMVTGVSTGFMKTLEIEGVGYRAEMDGKNLIVYVGYSHPVKVEPKDGITFEAETKTRQIKVIGIDNELVGQVAADIRKIRPPEPYKGKGIHYLGEHLRHKPGKSAKTKAA